MKYVDLHIHSYYSDGVDTPLQIIRSAKVKGLNLISISDHDNLRGYFRGINEAKRWGIDLVPGVEITTIEHHLLALSFNPFDKQFRNYIEHSRQVYEGVCRQRIDLLKKDNIPITFEKVKNAFPTSSLGKYAILWTMLLDDPCRTCLESRHGKLVFQELFNIYLSARGVAGKVDKKRAITWNETVKQVKQAGGLVIIPHPNKDNSSPEDIAWMYSTADGIEIQPRFMKEALPFAEYAKKLNKIITFGSDYHTSHSNSSILGKNENQIEDSLADRLRWPN